MVGEYYPPGHFMQVHFDSTPQLYAGSERVIGKCSKCGGEVVSHVGPWWGINPPVPNCRSCGAVKDETANLPVIPMK